MRTAIFTAKADTQVARRRPPAPLLVVLSYEDRAAGKLAMELLTRIGAQMNGSVSFKVVPWSFALLADADWSHDAAADAVKADILIIASSAKACPLPPSTASWTENVIAQKFGTHAAVIALFFSDACPDGADSPRLCSIRHWAKQAQLECFAPSRSAEPTPSSAGIDSGLSAILGRTSESTPSSSVAAPDAEVWP